MESTAFLNLIVLLKERLTELEQRLDEGVRDYGSLAIDIKVLCIVLYDSLMIRGRIER